MSEVQRLTEILHKKQCTYDHTDMYSWYYESWENPGWTYKQYTEKAKALLSIVDYETAVRVVEVL